MAQNILTAENLVKYINPARAGSYNINSIWTTNDGENCMNLPPNPYYWTSDGTYYQKVLCDYFQPGKRYVFDLWIDSDTAIYQSINRGQGINVYYTDGTYSSLIVYGSDEGEEEIGYQHIKFVTPSDKDVLGIMFYYYTSTPTYYRWDSSITEYTNTSVEKTGVLDTGILKENSDIASLVNGGEITCDRILEI